MKFCPRSNVLGKTEMPATSLGQETTAEFISCYRLEATTKKATRNTREHKSGVWSRILKSSYFLLIDFAGAFLGITEHPREHQRIRAFSEHQHQSIRASEPGGRARSSLHLTSQLIPHHKPPSFQLPSSQLAPRHTSPHTTHNPAHSSQLTSHHVTSLNFRPAINGP